jgi:16S rRNA (uracil1498-N3)-methyltransferase
MATRGDARGSGAERAWHDPLPASGEVVLAPEESAHLVRVRRVGVGEAVVLFDGRGASRHGTLIEADPRAARVALAGEAPDRAPAHAVVVATSVPEPGRADELVEGLAWLGVTAWVPLAFRRTPGGRLDLVARRGERWRRIALEAAKGNGRSRLLDVMPARSFAELLAAPPADGLVLLDPDPAAPPLAALLEPRAPRPWLVVGPEGGLDEAERNAAFTAGVRTASLGGPVLRVELAGQAAAVLALTLP